MYFKGLTELLDEPGETFPKRSELTILRGKTLTRTPTWHKAVVLVEVGDKQQLRLYGWQRTKDDEWRVRQKFNIAKGYAFVLAGVCEAYAQSW